MKIISKFDYSKVLYSKKNNLNLLLQAIAPRVDLKEERKSINIITAIDTSGSMAGDKIDYAKKSLLKLIDHLGPNDTLGLIEFTTDVRVMSEPVKMSTDNKAKLKSDILSLRATDSTNFSGALVTALDMSKNVDGDCRIIMFTDGLPNVGITNQDQLFGMLDSKVKKGVSITSFGYGSDHDTDLLTKISKFGGGNYAYIKNPDDALTAFAVELGGLLSCYAQTLKFTIKPKDGVEIKEVISDLDVTEEADGAICVSIADIYSEETKSVVLDVTIPEQTKFFPRETSLVDVVLSYVDANGEKQRVESKAKVQFVKTEKEVSAPDTDVATPLAIARLAQAQTQATIFAKSGNMAAAQATIQGVQGVCGATGVQGIQGILRDTEFYFSSSASYESNKISANSLNSTLTSGRGMGAGRSVTALTMLW